MFYDLLDGPTIWLSAGVNLTHNRVDFFKLGDELVEGKAENSVHNGAFSHFRMDGIMLIHFRPAAGQIVHIFIGSSLQ